MGYVNNTEIDCKDCNKFGGCTSTSYFADAPLLERILKWHYCPLVDDQNAVCEHKRPWTIDTSNI